MRFPKSHLRQNRKLIYILIAISFATALVLGMSTAQSSAASDIGYRDFSYPSGTGGNSEPSGEKPESKLWWNDGYWWGSLWNTSADAYHIYRLNESTQSWEDTGTAIDTRQNSRGDALWDGQYLYIASHVFVDNGGAPASAGQRGELFRYSYDSPSKSYSLDSGFPVEITGGKSETLVIEKDSTGQLWVTYVENDQVMVNHSVNGDDTNWGTPFVLPVGDAANVNGDDISSIITYNQHVGVMWSSQVSQNMIYFAVHPAGAPDHVWTHVRAYDVSGDDHISLKSMEVDSAGNVYAVVKTSRSSALVVLLVCERNINRCKTANDWSSYPVYTSSSTNPTRSILLLDDENEDLYVFSRAVDNGQEGIYYKMADMDNIQFQSGIGTAFINLSSDPDANNPTSTKQNVNSTTGLVVLASDKQSKNYLHNFMDLASTNKPIITSFTPTSGSTGTEVTISGSKFFGSTAVAFNDIDASSFIVDSDTQIRAYVPSGASTGKIRVTSPDGTGYSEQDFVIAVIPSISSFAPSNGPVGSEVTLTGTGFIGTSVVAFNGTSASEYTVDSDTQIRANVPSGAATGPIRVTNAASSGTSATDFVVRPPFQYTLSWGVTGAGSVVLDPPGGTYDETTVVRLTAQPGIGYGFSHWSGDLSGATNPEYATMNDNKHVTANFVEQSGGPVVHEETITGSSTSSNSVSTAGDATGIGGELYVAAISFRTAK